MCSILDNGGDMYCTTLSKHLYPFDISIMNKYHSISEELLDRMFKYPNDEKVAKHKASLLRTCLYFSDIDGADYCVRAGKI